MAFIFLFAPLLTLAKTDNQSFGGLPIIGLGLVLLCLCVTIGAVSRHPTFTAKKIGALIKVLGLSHLEEKMVQRAERFLSGLTVFRSVRRTLISLIQTVCIWGISGITFWSTLIAFDLHEPGFSVHCWSKVLNQWRLLSHLLLDI